MNNIKIYKDISYLENLKNVLKTEIFQIQNMDNKIIKKNIIKKLYSLYKKIDNQMKKFLNYESRNLELIPTPPDTEENVLHLEELLNSDLSDYEHDNLEKKLHANFSKQHRPDTFTLVALLNDMPEYTYNQPKITKLNNSYYKIKKNPNKKFTTIKQPKKKHHLKQQYIKKYRDLSNVDLSNVDLSNRKLTNPNQINRKLTNAKQINPKQNNPKLTNYTKTNNEFTNNELTNNEISNNKLTNNELTNNELTNTKQKYINNTNNPINYDETSKLSFFNSF